MVEILKLDISPNSCKWWTVWCVVTKPYRLETVEYKYQPGDAFMAKIDGQGVIRQLVTGEEIPADCIRIFDIVGGGDLVIGVMVILKGRKAKKDFRDEELGKAFFLKAKARFGAENTFLISLTKAIPPPEGYTPKRAQKKYWCPFCGDERRFNHDSSIDAERCCICGITDREFYVRKYNHLWPQTDPKDKKGRRRVELPVGDKDPSLMTKAEKRKLRRQLRKEAKNNGGNIG